MMASNSLGLAAFNVYAKSKQRRFEDELMKAIQVRWPLVGNPALVPHHIYQAAESSCNERGFYRMEAHHD